MQRNNVQFLPRTATHSQVSSPHFLYVMFCQAPMPYITNRQGGEQDYYFSILLAYWTMECSLKSPTSYVTNRISFPFPYFVFTWGESLGTRQISLNIIRLTHTDVWESMGKPCSCMQFIRSCIFTTSHARICISTASEHAVGPKVHMIKSLSP